MRITEDNFISRMIKRDEDALEYFIDNYGWVVKTVVSKQLYNLKSIQEECINDVFLGIWNNISSFDPSRSNFKNWTAAIAKYKSIDYKRKYLKNIEQTSIDDLTLCSAENPEEEMLKMELNDDIKELINCLAERDRELFYKLYIEEKDMDDVSKETGFKKDVIYNRLSRGKKKLRDMLRIMESRG